MSYFISEYKKIPLSEIEPEGWLKRQLIIQNNGLTGHIDGIWEDLSDNSAWLGGSGEAWERGPYYIDGLITLAYLLKDEKLIAKSKKWIDSILNSERENGDFGPLRNPDWWPRMVVLKALVNYYRTTSDERIIPFMLKYLKYQYGRLDDFPPEYWASARALEHYEAIEAVYEITKEPFLIDLIEKLKSYMYDWTGYFKDFRYIHPMTEYFNRAVFKLGKAILEPIDRRIKAKESGLRIKSREEILKFNKTKTVELITYTHGVNIAMAYKYPIVYGASKGGKTYFDIVKKGYDDLMKIHGTAIGLHSSDEHLMGNSPSQGTELCTVVEEMYSWEECLRITGDPDYADRLEFLAYNALPATFSDDMTAHQYVQQPNQIDADIKNRQFYDTDKEANIFGLAPNFGCCAANMHQGFPKFVSNLVFKTKDGLAFLIYGPCGIKTKINGRPFEIKEDTDYPFDNKISFTVTEADNIETVFLFRKPLNYIFNINFNGEKQETKNEEKIVSISKKFNKGDRIDIELEPQIKITDNPGGSISIRRGSLLMALSLEYEEKYVRGEKPFHYREYIRKGGWNFAPVLNNGNLKVISIAENPSDGIPFDSKNPCIKMTVEGREILNWKKEKNSAGDVPEKPVQGGMQKIMLSPYGATKLRVSHFPKITE